MLRGGCWLDVLHYIPTGEQKKQQLASYRLQGHLCLCSLKVYQCNKAQTKALGKCSPGLVWQQRIREAFRGTLQWYQQISHVLSLILFPFFVLPVETDIQSSPFSTSHVSSDGSLLRTMIAFDLMASLICLLSMGLNFSSKPCIFIRLNTPDFSNLC